MTRLDRSRLLKEAEPPPLREHLPSPSKRKRLLVSLILGETGTPAKKRPAVGNQGWSPMARAYPNLFDSLARLPPPTFQAFQIDQSRGGNFRNSVTRSHIDPAAARSHYSDWKPSERSWLGSPVVRSVLGPEHTAATKSWLPTPVETPVRLPSYLGMSGGQHRDAFRLSSKQSRPPSSNQVYTAASVKRPSQEFLNYQQLLSRNTGTGPTVFRANGETSIAAPRGGEPRLFDRPNDPSTELQLGSGVSAVPDEVLRETETLANITPEVSKVPPPQWGVLLQEANNPGYTRAQASRQEEIDLVLKQKEICKLGFEKAKAELQKRKDAAEALAEKIRKSLVVKDKRLSEEAEEEVSKALAHGSNIKLVEHGGSSIIVTRKILSVMNPGGWLNDEVVNLYMELLKERETRTPNHRPKCHFFNSFFYPKLYSTSKKYDYKGVKRWTSAKKLGYALRECDKVIVPIHLEVHWTLAVINIRDKSFYFLDSMFGNDRGCLKQLARYIVDEVADKSASTLDVSSWKYSSPNDIPAQENGCDCGVFMVTYADYEARDEPFDFSQDDMPTLRRRMVHEILKLRVED